MDLLKVAIALGFVSIGLVAWYLNSEKEKEFEDLLLEGATLSNLPSLYELLNNPSPRDAIKANVVEIGFNPCVSVSEGRHGEEYVKAEAFLIDDGGGVHVLSTVTAITLAEGPIAKLETDSAELARLFAVPLRT